MHKLMYIMAAVIYPPQTANIIVCFKSRMSSSFYIEGHMHTAHFNLQWAEPAKLPSLSVLICFTTYFILFNIRKRNSILTAQLCCGKCKKFVRTNKYMCKITKRVLKKRIFLLEIEISIVESR